MDAELKGDSPLQCVMQRVISHNVPHMTARKVVIHRSGGYERLKLEPLTVPAPNA